MGKWRDKVFCYSHTYLLQAGRIPANRPRDRFRSAGRSWIVVDRPMNMLGYLVVEETPQGDRIAATIAFLRWLLRIYGWTVCRGFRTYAWVYGKIPRPDPYGTIPMPFTPFWTGEGIPLVDENQRQPQSPTGAILNGGNLIRSTLIYANPPTPHLDPVAERQYWYGGEMTNTRPSWIVSDPSIASLEPGLIVRGQDGARIIPATPSPAE